MVDSFSALYPNQNTHQIRIWFTLLTNVYLLWLLMLQHLVVALHSLRQVHSTGHSEFIFVVRRS